MQRKVFLLRGGSVREKLSIERRGSRYRIVWGDRVEDFEALRLPDGRVSLLFDDGRQLCGRVVPREAGQIEVVVVGQVQRVRLAEPLRDHLARATEQARGGEGEEEIRALMPGRVVEVCVKAGQRVEPGTLLLVLEAMKMQNELRAARGGIVDRVSVSAGQAVEGGTSMLTVRSAPP